jgi:hypothetical protein
MTDQEQRPIVPPVADKKREIARGVAEATVELIPGASIVTKILQVVVPPKGQTGSEAWQKAISERTNQNTGRLDEHERLLKPTTTLSDTAAQLAVALASACPDGLGHEEFDLDALCSLLPEMDRPDIEDATADLEVLGLVERERFLGKHWTIRLTSAFCLQLDGQIMGWDTTADAVTVARILPAPLPICTGKPVGKNVDLTLRSGSWWVFSRRAGFLKSYSPIIPRLMCTSFLKIERFSDALLIK